MSTIKNFLLVFDHAKNELLEQVDFGTDIDRATQAYAQMEEQYLDNHRVDIVLVGSDSLETVKVTHSTYFVDGARSLIDLALSGS